MRKGDFCDFIGICLDNRPKIVYNNCIVNIKNDKRMLA